MQNVPLSTFINKENKFYKSNKTDVMCFEINMNFPHILQFMMCFMLIICYTNFRSILCTIYSRLQLT